MRFIVGGRAFSAAFTSHSLCEVLRLFCHSEPALLRVRNPYRLSSDWSRRISQVFAFCVTIEIPHPQKRGFGMTIGCATLLQYSPLRAFDKLHPPSHVLSERAF